MPRVKVYTTPYCPFCVMAKRLLDQRGVPYEEIMIDGYSEEQREALFKRSGMMTVPQIFLDDKDVIGGFDELAELDRKQGGLDSLK